MKIKIYYRHVHSSAVMQKNRPVWFSHKACFENLIESIKSAPKEISVDLTVMFDGSEMDFQDDFICNYESISGNKLLGEGRVFKINKFRGGDQKSAWIKSFDTAVTELDFSTKSTLIYFLENDYLHQLDWCAKLLDLIETGIKFEYLSLYDHLDKYENTVNVRNSEKYRKLKSKIFVSKHCHWRTTPSTCGSFILTQDTLLRDCRLLKLGLKDRHAFPILTGLLKRKLLTPIPSLSTHCMADYLAPCVDWHAVQQH